MELMLRSKIGDAEIDDAEKTVAKFLCIGSNAIVLNSSPNPGFQWKNRLKNFLKFF